MKLTNCIKWNNHKTTNQRNFGGKRKKLEEFTPKELKEITAA